MFMSVTVVDELDVSCAAPTRFSCAKDLCHKQSALLAVATVRLAVLPGESLNSQFHARTMKAEVLSY